MSNSSITTSSPFRAALVGAGGIASTHYNGYLKADALVMGFAEPFESTRILREKEWSVKGYTSLEEMLENAQLEAVSICTPNAFHFESTLKAARAGKHILCEKPLSMSIAECTEMIRVCEESGVVLQTNHHLRSNLLVQAAKKLIDSGAIGEVSFVRLRQAHDWGGSKSVRPSFGLFQNSGGGTLLDNGCHMMDLARYFCGEVGSLYARTASLRPDIEVEDVGVVSLEFKNGAIGSVEASWNATGWEEGFWVYGTDGALECTNRLGKRVLKHIHRSSGGGWDEVDVTVHDFHSEGGHSLAIQNFIRSVREGMPVVCTGQDGLESVRLILAAYESARENKPLEIVAG
jgi:predicted dehydrogenase